MELLRRVLFMSVLLLPVGTTAQPAAPETMQAAEFEALLMRDADPAARRASMQKLVSLAQSGQGYPTFVLGALYRHGMEHPARLVERDDETARHWLDKCVDSTGCPLMALASLAELELAAGNAKPAMQWAQAWVVLEREFNRQSRTSPVRTHDEEYQFTSYQAYLIGRCYKAMPNTRDPGALGMQWFNELRSARGKSLDRMLFDALDRDSNSGWINGKGVEITADNQRHKEVEASAPQPVSPAAGLYLYRGSPTGGRAENVVLVEALPAPLAARGLVHIARNVRTKPYRQEEGSAKRYGLLPVSYNDWQHSLIPDKK